MPDQFDVSLEDSDLLGEVELTTNLIIAASETDEHLTDAEIDEILGVAPAPHLTARRRAPGYDCAQQVAKSTGPVLRSESTRRVRARRQPHHHQRAVRRSPTSPGTGRRSCRPGRAPARRASVARCRRWSARRSSSANSNATRTTPSGSSDIANAE